MTEFTIREATPADQADVDAVSASAVATLRQTYRPTQKAIAHKQSITETLTRLVAVLNDRVVGTLQYRIQSDRIHFISLGVDADHRRLGVARQLIAELVRIGKIAGAPRVSTYTVTQTGNCAIFERMGFRAISEEPTDFYESDHIANLTETYLERPIP